MNCPYCNCGMIWNGISWVCPECGYDEEDDDGCVLPAKELAFPKCRINLNLNERKTMTLALAFAIIMLVWLVVGFLNFRAPQPHGSWPIASALIIFILFVLVGWKVFGPLIHP